MLDETKVLKLKKSVKQYKDKIRWDLYENDRYVGWGGIRNRTTTAGDVVYRIKTDERMKGYGTKLLTMLLKKAHELGKREIVVVTRQSNAGSIKIIERNGGQLVKRINLKGKEERLMYSIAV